jgi:hypothetical protein
MIFQKLKKTVFFIMIVLVYVLSLGSSVGFSQPVVHAPFTPAKVRIVLSSPPDFIPQRYVEFLYGMCKKYEVPYLMVYKLIETESEWKQIAVNENLDKNGNVVSIDVGRMQLNSKSVKWMIEKFGKKWKKYDIVNNAYDNTEIGVRYLAHLYSIFKDWKLAVMAYNCGPTAVLNNCIPARTLKYGDVIVPVDFWWEVPDNVELVEATN